MLRLPPPPPIRVGHDEYAFFDVEVDICDVEIDVPPYGVFRGTYSFEQEEWLNVQLLPTQSGDTT